MNNPNDSIIYEQELSPWLPSKIIDCHVHVGLNEHLGPVEPERLNELWALDVANYQTWEDLSNTHKMLFPKQEVSVLAFGWVYKEIDIPANNDYVLEGISDPSNHAKGLIVTLPEWDASVITDAFKKGYCGIKPYPDLCAQGMNDASIYDFIPESHLSELDRLKGILMLHLPRPGRLGSPDNIRELREISQAYPSITIIVAHIGRAYGLPAAKSGLPHLANLPNVYFDTSANLNADVFQFALDTVGPDKILYGSDLPVTLMRGMREHIGDKYINYTDGDYSWNTNRKSPEEELKYTYFLYEELRALIKALQSTGLGKDAMKKIMYSNTARLLTTEC